MAARSQLKMGQNNMTSSRRRFVIRSQGIARSNFVNAATRLFTLLIVCLTLSVNLRYAAAEMLSYDNGRLGDTQDRGMFAAVRFTNPYPDDALTVEDIQVYGNRQTSGNITLYLWKAVDGKPGDVLATLTGEALGRSGWYSFDFSSFDIQVAPGSDIFGGFYEGRGRRWADASYDSNATTTGRSWYKTGNAWKQGEPGPHTNGDLMVRLDCTHSSAVPEPGAFALLATGAAGCVCTMRRRSR
jgi:hypothetical protein